MSFADWTGQLRPENCMGLTPGTPEDIACNQRNNAMSVAVQEIQEQYNACVPTGSTITVDSSGRWSVSSPVPACPPNDPNCRNTLQVVQPDTSAYVSSNNPFSGGYGAITVTPVVPPSDTSGYAPPAQQQQQQQQSSSSGSPPSSAGGAVPQYYITGSQTSQTGQSSSNLPAETSGGLTTNTLLLIGAGVAALFFLKR
jgi:hypothetical protein